MLERQLQVCEVPGCFMNTKGRAKHPGGGGGAGRGSQQRLAHVFRWFGSILGQESLPEHIVWIGIRGGCGSLETSQKRFSPLDALLPPVVIDGQEGGVAQSVCLAHGLQCLVPPQIANLSNNGWADPIWHAVPCNMGSFANAGTAERLLCFSAPCKYGGEPNTNPTRAEAP